MAIECIQGVGLAVVPGVEQTNTRGELGWDVNDVLAIFKQSLCEGSAGSVAALDRPEAVRPLGDVLAHRGVAGPVGGESTRAKQHLVMVDDLDGLYKVVGANSGLESLDDVTLEALARSRNDLRRLSAILPDGRTLLRSVTLSPAGSAAISARVTRHWGATLTAAQKAEAVAVETAVELLMSRGNRILYVGRPGPVPGAATHLSQGPDIVAVTPAGRTVIVGAKGAVNKLSINNTRLKSTVAGRIERQPTRRWLASNAGPRYRDVMTSSTDLGVREAASRLNDITANSGAYDAVIVGASPKTSLGKLDDTREELHTDPGVVTEVVHVDVQIP